MRKTISEFLVGLTVLLGLVGVAVLLLLFGEFNDYRTKFYTATLQLNDVSGLSTASNLTLNGVPIGTIGAIESSADPRDGVLVMLRINQGVRVPRDVTVSLDQGLVGEATLSLRTLPRDDGSEIVYLAEGETVRMTASGMMDRITAMLDERMSSFTEAAQSFTRLSQTLEEAGEHLKSVLEPRTPEAVDAGETQANLASTLARLDLAVRDARSWLGHDGMRADVQETVSRMKTLMDDASKAVEAWTSAAESLSTNAQTLGDEGVEAMRELSTTARTLGETMNEVQVLLGKVNSGEGTAGLLLTNPDLYRSMNDAAVRLERTLTEAQLLFEKYRKEGLPIRF